MFFVATGAVISVFCLKKNQPVYFLLDLSGVSALDLSACIALSNLSKNLRTSYKVKTGLVGVTGKFQVQAPRFLPSTICVSLRFLY